MFSSFLRNLVSSIDINLIIFVAIFVFVTLFVIVFITIIIAKERVKEKIHKLREKLVFTTHRNFVFDIKNRKVRCFTVNKENTIREVSMDDFLSKILPTEEKNFRYWLDALIEKDYEYEDKFTVLLTTLDVGFKKDKSKYVRFAFHVTRVIKEKRLVFIDSYCLKNIPVALKKKDQKNKLRKHKELVSSLEDLRLYFNQEYFKKGNVYYIKIYEKERNTLLKTNRTLIDWIILDRLLSVFKIGNCFIYRSDLSGDNSSEFLIFEMKLQIASSLSRFSSIIDNRLGEVFEIHSYEREYDFKIVCSKITDLTNNFEENLTILKNLERFMEEDQEKKVIVYRKQNTEIQSLASTYRDEIDKILKDKSIEVSFRSIVHITTKRVMTVGFMGFLTLNKSGYFKTYDNFSKTAEKLARSKDVFSLEARKIIPTFVSQKESTNLKLVYFIDMKNVQNVTSTLSHIGKVKDANLILTFENNDFIDIEDDINLIRQIKSFKEKDYELGIRVRIDDYTLKDSVYSMFDFFFFDIDNVKNIKQNSREFLKIHSLLEKFVKYRKPLVVINCPSWTAIELLIRSGITYFSSDAISPKSPMLLPIDKKMIKKLSNTYKN